MEETINSRNKIIRQSMYLTIFFPIGITSFSLEMSALRLPLYPIIFSRILSTNSCRI